MSDGPAYRGHAHKESMGELLNLVGLSAGIVLYAMLLFI